MTTNSISAKRNAVRDALLGKASDADPAEGSDEDLTQISKRRRETFELMKGKRP